MRIELIDPHMDKNFSVQFFDCTSDEMVSIKQFFFMHTNTVPTFLQGFDRDWVMIEFWTFLVEEIIEYCELIEKHFNLKVKGL